MQLVGMATCGLVLLLISEDYRKSIAPLRQKEAEATRDAKELRERIVDADIAIVEIRARGMDLEHMRGETDRAQAELPEGSVRVSFPAWMKDHFAHSGLGISTIRLTAAQDEPNGSGYERGFWSVSVPIDEAGRNIPKLLVAVADMDQQNSFLRVLDFEIRLDAGKQGERVGLLTLGTVLRK